MKKLFFIFSLVIGCLFTTPVFGAEIGDNLLTNGSFISGLDSWDVFVPSSPFLYYTTSTISADGDNASITLSSGGNDGMTSCITQTFSWALEDITELSFYQKSSSTYPHPQQSFYLTQYDLLTTSTGWIFNWITAEWEEKSFESLPTSDYQKVITLNYQIYAKNTLASNIPPPEIENDTYLFTCTNFPQDDQFEYLDVFNLEVIDKVGSTPETPTTSTEDSHIMNTLLLVLAFILGVDLLRRIFTPLDKRRGL